MANGITVFATPDAEHLLDDICKKNDFRRGNATFGQYPDGELWVQIENSVAGHDVFVVGTTEDFHLAMLLDAARRSSASRVTAFVTYAKYSRALVRKEDRREAISFPLAFAPVLWARPHQIVFLEFWRLEAFGLSSVDYRSVYSSTYMVPKLKSTLKDCIYKVIPLYPSGHKRAVRYAELLGFPYLESVKHVMQGDSVLITDSFLTSTDDLLFLISKTQEVDARGASSVSASFSHTKLPEDANRLIEASALKTLFVSDHLKVNVSGPQIVVAQSAPTIGEVIRRIHHGESLSPEAIATHLNHHYP